MRIGAVGRSRGGEATAALPAWPPLLAVRGPGSASAPHAHHAMHVVLATRGTLRVRTSANGAARRAAGVLTAPDVAHAIDAEGVEVVLVFLDPESDVGVALRAALSGAVRLLTPSERDVAMEGADPAALMTGHGPAWTARLVTTLGAEAPPPAPLHPRVRRALAILRASPDDASLASLAAAVDLSPSRFLHAFTASIGIPLRPYVAWLRLQRAAGAIVGGASLARAAADAGFSDAAHMSRSFRKMLGMPPSALVPRAVGVARRS